MGLEDRTIADVERGYALLLGAVPPFSTGVYDNEDVVQEVALRTLREAPDSLGRAYNPAFFWWMVYQVRADLHKGDAAMKRGRGWRRVGLHVLSTDGVEKEVMDRLDVQAAVARLPKRQREIISSFYFQGRTKQEIASDLGLSPRTVETHLYRARDTLRKALGRDYGE